MSHLNSACRPERLQPIPGGPRKFNLISTLSDLYGGFSGGLKGPENVDGAWLALYKTRNGGGRNPAAAVL
jgi:hypothetical protein